MARLRLLQYFPSSRLCLGGMATWLSIMWSGSPLYAAEETTASLKGAGGGALLGAELITITESLFDVRNPWLYVAGASVGGIGGGFLGYSLSAGSERTPAYLLAGGLVLFIPALICTFNGTRYRYDGTSSDEFSPPEMSPNTHWEDLSSTTLLPSSLRLAQGRSSPQRMPARSPFLQSTPSRKRHLSIGKSAYDLTQYVLPDTLFFIKDGKLKIGVPIPKKAPLYSLHERRQFGMRQRSVWQLALLRVDF